MLWEGMGGFLQSKRELTLLPRLIFDLLLLEQDKISSKLLNTPSPTSSLPSLLPSRNTRSSRSGLLTIWLGTKEWMDWFIGDCLRYGFDLWSFELAPSYPFLPPPAFLSTTLP